MNQVYDIFAEIVRKEFLQTRIVQELRTMAERIESGEIKLDFGDSIVITATQPTGAT